MIEPGPLFVIHGSSSTTTPKKIVELFTCLSLPSASVWCIISVPESCYIWIFLTARVDIPREFPFLRIQILPLVSALTRRKLKCNFSVWLYCDMASGQLSLKVTINYSQDLLLTGAVEGQCSECSSPSLPLEPFWHSVLLIMISPRPVLISCSNWFAKYLICF